MRANIKFKEKNRNVYLKNESKKIKNNIFLLSFFLCKQKNNVENFSKIGKTSYISLLENNGNKSIIGQVINAKEKGGKKIECKL